MSSHQPYYIHFSSIDVILPMTIPFQQLVANDYRDLPEEIRALILSPLSRTIIYPRIQEGINILSPINRPVDYYNGNILYYCDSDSDDDIPDLIEEDNFTEEGDDMNIIHFYNDISRNIPINKKECSLYTGYRRKNYGLE